MWREHYARLARYNHWQNGQILNACAALDDAERKADRGLFFRSIHGTLNHLLLTDRMWLGRFIGTPFPARSLAQELYADFDTLRRERRLTDRALADYTATLEEDQLAGDVHYVSASTGQSHRRPLGLCLTHLFNHQTHHRGQLTASLSQLGQDFGTTDLIFMPDDVQP
ncbi:DinB family protein [Alcanivorax sp. 521-1]|uniref:DinB family protein n=1 Tax=Alloalcanivorax profundimaris TaxID=2735259 RepID=A0ABS0AQK3_9GAMM|nr:DinB family protein [Alloalcanivorax profundimaris]MBF5056418.1 DinB family protein [Alloalcanivorax profundimaris]